MLKTYWWNEAANFGDSIAPLLLRKFSGIKTEWGGLHECDFIVTGSVLHHVPRNYRGVIVGAGRLRADLPVEVPYADVRAIRGPLSADGLALPMSSFALGDPGLLANELVPTPTRHIKLGILPHWTDSKLAHRPEFAPYNPFVIKPSWKPLDVIAAIGQCEKLVTSSLHGLILADAYGIPRRFEPCPLFDLDTLFKFRDYSESINFPLEIGKTQLAPRGHVQLVKDELYDAFGSLRPPS
jgi:pyruvyltransferase